VLYLVYTHQVTSLRAVQKKNLSQPEAGFTGRDGGQDRPNCNRARYLAILSMEGVAIGELPVEEARVVSVLKSHPKADAMRASEREALAMEVMDVLSQLEGEERDIAAKLFRLVFGAEEHIPEQYMHAVTEITFASAAERRAESKREAQRPFMIAEYSKKIRQDLGYYRALPELEEGIGGMDDDIRRLAQAALKTLFGNGGHKETLEALTLLEWIPSRTIDEYGPAGAILEACELWQKIRNETRADDELALAGVCALGVILDDEIRPTNMASQIINNLRIDITDIHEGIVDAVKLTQA
jgi:hypothetical protein